MLPGRLLAPAPGWTVTYDVVIVGSGIAGLTAALAAAEKVLADAAGVEVDYLVIRGTDLAELDEDAQGEARALVAAKVGTTRLIDNLPVVLGAGPRH